MATEIQVLIQDASDYDAVGQLWAQYWDEHHEDLGAQDLATEARALPDGYEDGAILVAVVDGQVVGTVAMKRYDDITADMKRMYVPAEYRGMGIGEALVEAIVESARHKGYKQMVLDTTESMTAARRLYRKYGFTDADGFAHSPCNGPVYMMREL